MRLRRAWLISSAAQFSGKKSGLRSYRRDVGLGGLSSNDHHRDFGFVCREKPTNDAVYVFGIRAIGELLRGAGLPAMRISLALASTPVPRSTTPQKSSVENPSRAFGW